MENIQQERVLAYTVSTPIDQNALEKVTGGANSGQNLSGRVVITGDHGIPDVVIEI